MALFKRFRKDRRGGNHPVSPDTPATEKITLSRTPTGGMPRRGPEDSDPSAQTMIVPGGKIVAVLIATAGQLENEVFRIFDGPNKLGRGDACQVVLPSQRISREHALINHANGGFTIKALSERNPTRINGESAQGGELKDGDTLKMGDSTLRFRTVN